MHRISTTALRQHTAQSRKNPTPPTAFSLPFGTATAISPHGIQSLPADTHSGDQEKGPPDLPRRACLSGWISCWALLLVWHPTTVGEGSTRPITQHVPIGFSLPRGPFATYYGPWAFGGPH